MLLQLASSLALGHVVFTDFKGRYIHLFTMIAILGLTIGRVYWLGTWAIWEFFALNLIFVTLLLAISIWVVAKKQHKHWTDIMGLGDILFLYLLCFWMDTVPFVIYFNVSLLVSLVLHFLLLKFSWYRADRGVPFAGYFAFTLVIFLLMP